MRREEATKERTSNCVFIVSECSLFSLSRSDLLQAFLSFATLDPCRTTCTTKAVEISISPKSHRGGTRVVDFFFFVLFNLMGG